MKLGIVGSGVIVEEFVPRLKELEGLEILGIQATPRSLEKAKGMCETYSIPLATDNFDVLCDSGIDTVYVAVPNHLHHDVANKALEKGLNVIVEKPMTSNAKEAHELATLAKEKNLFLFEAITTLYLGNYHKVQEWLPLIGDIKIVQSQVSQYSRRYDAFQAGEVLPAFDVAKAGGAMMDLNLYNLHFVMGLWGRPDSATYYANIERDIDTSGVVMLNYPSFVAMCVAAKDSKGTRGAIIQGTKGVIRTNNAPNIIGEVFLELNDGTEEHFDDGMMRNRVAAEFKVFIEAINTNNLEFCYNQLKKSLDVCEVQTQARLEAGIRFTADE